MTAPASPNSPVSAIFLIGDILRNQSAKQGAYSSHPNCSKREESAEAEHGRQKSNDMRNVYHATKKPVAADGGREPEANARVDRVDPEPYLTSDDVLLDISFGVEEHAEEVQEGEHTFCAWRCEKHASWREDMQNSGNEGRLATPGFIKRKNMAGESTKS